MEKVNCKICDKCGGCNLLHLSYKETLDYKKKLVLDCFKKEKINATIDNIYGDIEGNKYRNKMIVGFKYQNNKIVSGFYEENSHKIVELDSCIMHSDSMNNVYKTIKNAVVSLRIRPYDEDRRTGLLRYVLIRESSLNKDILVCFITSEEMFPARNELVKIIRKENPNIKTIIQNINPRKTSIVLGEKERILYGNGYIVDSLGGLKFNLSSKTFFQINQRQANVLYGIVKNKINNSELFNNKKVNMLFDCYSGVGTIGMSLSDIAKNILCIENNASSNKAAIINSKLNNITNVRFINKDATEFINEVSNNHEPCDVIVMDPPRTGSTESFLKACLKMKPKMIVYVSCGPDTLARDLNVLLTNYNIKSIDLVDLFCFTKHIETVVCLERK